MIDVTLASLLNVFESYGLTAEIRTQESEPDFQQLMLLLGQDDKERPFWLQVRIIDPKATKSFPASSENFALLNFFLLFPYQIPTERLSDIGRLVLAANKTLPLLGFGLSEAEGALFYQYNLPLNHHKLHQDTLLGCLASVIFAKESYSPLFDRVVTGESYESLLQLSSQR
jgi:hypothetical protein